ncbi:MAG: hypothetical protein ACOY41_12385 [Pseudomonadota bacterium]
MPKNLTKRLAFIIGFLMMSFVYCQGMAQAAVVASQLPQERSAGMMSCHGEVANTASGMDCPGDCQSLDKALDSFGPVLAAPDYVPVLIGILLLPTDEPSPRFAAPSPPDPSSDPPLAIRFQRFRL